MNRKFLVLAVFVLVFSLVLSGCGIFNRVPGASAVASAVTSALPTMPAATGTAQLPKNTQNYTGTTTLPATSAPAATAGAD